MRKLEDLDNVVLQEGETLILRPRNAMTDEQMRFVQEVLNKRGIKAVVVPAGFDIFVTGELALAGVEHVQEPTQEELRQEVIEAFDAGKIVQAKITGNDKPAYEHFPDDWFAIHRNGWPRHLFAAHHPIKYRLNKDSPEC